MTEDNARNGGAWVKTASHKIRVSAGFALYNDTQQTECEEEKNRLR
jgi:hypothetical protein